MATNIVLYIFYIALAIYILRKLYIRLQLSKAKHPSLRGHAKMSRRVAKWVPFYEYKGDQFFASDGAPQKLVEQRKAAFNQLKQRLAEKSPQTIAASQELEDGISDVIFTNAYRVPFQYRNYIKDNLKLGTLVTASRGTQVQDLDGNWSYDLSGSYGVNVFGYDFYKDCMDKAWQQVRDLGPVLGAYHPLIADNVKMLKQISGLDEVSFHMSGTEAVMQAVRLARYHTRKTHLVRFCGSYHGWWDGVQPGIGNDRKTSDVYTLKDMDKDTLRVLRTRKDIACVLVNPLQALHPNANAPGDAMLINSERHAHYDREAYTQWLHELRKVCHERGIVFIIDDVFLGFRLAYGGSQEYFGLQADMVTYGKTLGGGMPVGVVCGKHALMKRFRDDQPTHISFARGTFNSHPYVMAAMHEFLQRIQQPPLRDSYTQNDQVWDERVRLLNNRLAQLQLPVKVVNMSSVWTIIYTQPGRYNWMFQYYLRDAGLAISWVGSGRIIMSHNFSDDEYDIVMQRFVSAAQAMQAGGWWWSDTALTNKSIKKQVFREMLRVVFK